MLSSLPCPSASSSPADSQITATNAVKTFTDFEYWPNGHPGLDRKRIEKTVKIQVIVGKKTKGRSGIQPGKTPMSYERFVDLSIWDDAMALVKKTN